MNVFTRIGYWVEKHFPEKLTSEEVKDFFKKEVANHLFAIDSLNKRLSDLESKLSIIKEEIISIKNQSNIKSRVVSSIDTMTPFASRPVNGGNK